MNHSKIIERVLLQMKGTLKSLDNGETVVQAGESGSLTNDEELRADVVLGGLAEKLLREYTFVRTIRVEGRDLVEVSPKGSIDVYVDQLDASLNYKHRGLLNTALPYSGVITFVDHNHPINFLNVVAAGVMNFASFFPDYWYAGEDAPTLINEQVAVPYTGDFGLTKIPVIGEFYYDSNRRWMADIFSGKQGYLRNCGSAAVEMCLVSSGQAAAFICDQQKGHELGAAYRIVKQAGGVIVDWKGVSFDEKPYHFNQKYEVILASTQEVADWIVERIAEVRRAKLPIQ